MCYSSFDTVHMYTALAFENMNHSEVINNTSAKQTIQLHPGQHFFQRKNELP